MSWENVERTHRFDTFKTIQAMTGIAPGGQILPCPHSRDWMTDKIFKGVLDVQTGLTYMGQRTVLSLRFEISSHISKALKVSVESGSLASSD